MADYARLRAFLEFAEDSGYLNKQAMPDIPDSDLTPDEVLSVKTEGTATVDLGIFTTITMMIVKNLDDTNAVTLGYNNAAGGVTPVLALDGLHVTTDVVAANDLSITPAAGTPKCLVVVFGT